MSWSDRALGFIRDLARGAHLTSDELIERVGLPDAGHTPNGRNNGVGSVFRHAAAAGLIVTDGRFVRSRQPRRKGGAIRVWVRT